MADSYHDIMEDRINFGGKVIDDNGADIGRTVGDQIEEVKQALIQLYGKTSPRKIEGEDWSVYRIGNILRADVKDHHA